MLIIDPVEPSNCSSASVDLNSCNSQAIAYNNMRFTSCQVATIDQVSTSTVYYDTVIEIQGFIFSLFWKLISHQSFYISYDFKVLDLVRINVKTRFSSAKNHAQYPHLQRLLLAARLVSIQVWWRIKNMTFKYWSTILVLPFQATRFLSLSCPLLIPSLPQLVILNFKLTF